MIENEEKIEEAAVAEEEKKNSICVDIEPKWFVLHTYSGYESMAQENLKLVFEKNGMKEKLFEVLVPMEDYVEDKGGKRKVSQRKKFPCYVIIKMIYDNSMWHMITNTRGVTGFVGPQGRPLALTPDEVRRMRLEKIATTDSSYKIGDMIKVISGALEGFTGIVESYDVEAGKIKVVVSMFGKDTPADLDVQQVEILD